MAVIVAEPCKTKSMTMEQLRQSLQKTFQELKHCHTDAEIQCLSKTVQDLMASTHGAHGAVGSRNALLRSIGEAIQSLKRDGQTVKAKRMSKIRTMFTRLPNETPKKQRKFLREILKLSAKNVGVQLEKKGLCGNSFCCKAACVTASVITIAGASVVITLAMTGGFDDSTMPLDESPVENDNTEISKKMEDLEKSNSAMDAYLSILEGQAKGTYDELVIAEDTNVDLRDQNYDLQDQNSDLQAQKSNLQGRNSDLQDEVGSTKRELASANADIANLEGELEGTHSRITGLKATLEKTENQLYDRTIKLGKSENHVADVLEELEVAQSVADEAGQRVLELKGDIQDLEASNEAQTQEVEDLENQLREAEENAESMERDLQAKSAELKDALDEIRTHRGEIEELQQSARDMESQLNALEDQNSRSLQENFDLQGQVDSTRGELEERIVELEQQKDTMDFMSNALEKQDVLLELLGHDEELTADKQALEAKIQKLEDMTKVIESTNQSEMPRPEAKARIVRMKSGLRAFLEQNKQYDIVLGDLIGTSEEEVKTILLGTIGKVQVEINNELEGVIQQMQVLNDALEQLYFDK